jgi:hypothetical protein
MSMGDVNKMYMHNQRQRDAEQRAKEKKMAVEATRNSSSGIVSFFLTILMHIMVALCLTSANTDDAERENLAVRNEPGIQRTESWTYIDGALAYECMGESDLEMYTGY